MSHAHRVRPVGAADEHAWLAMRKALWPQGAASLGTDVERFFGAGAPGLEAVFVAERAEDGELVGFIELSQRPWAEGCDTSPVGYVEGWYVAPVARRSGVGRALVEAAEAWTHERGLRELASDAEADNVLSHEAHLAVGFEDEGLVRCFSKEVG